MLNLFYLKRLSPRLTSRGLSLRTHNGFEAGYGQTTKSIAKLLTLLMKMGNNQIPYAHHQHNESYNCVAFVDDILSWAKDDIWSSRIEQLHEKYGLYIE